MYRYISMVLICLMSHNIWAQKATKAPKTSIKQASTSFSSTTVIKKSDVKSNVVSLSKRDMKDIDDVLALKEEILKNQNSPSYHYEKAMKHLLTSPYIIKPPYIDKRFPILIRSGNKEQDVQLYKRAKAEWTTKNPTQYRQQMAKRSLPPSSNK